MTGGGRDKRMEGGGSAMERVVMQRGLEQVVE
jgi:hypothetical protein